MWASVPPNSPAELGGHRKGPVGFLSTTILDPIALCKWAKLWGFLALHSIILQRPSASQSLTAANSTQWNSTFPPWLTNTVRPGPCFGQRAGWEVKDMKTFRANRTAGCWPTGRAQRGMPQKCVCLSRPLAGWTMQRNEVYNLVTRWHQPPLNCLTSLPAPTDPGWSGDSFHSTLPFCQHTQLLNSERNPDWAVTYFHFEKNSREHSFTMAVFHQPSLKT